MCRLHLPEYLRKMISSGCQFILTIKKKQVQSVDNKYTVVTETCGKTVQISSLTYRNYINRAMGKLYNILTLKNLFEKTDSKATSIRTRIETKTDSYNRLVDTQFKSNIHKNKD